MAKRICRLQCQIRIGISGIVTAIGVMVLLAWQGPYIRSMTLWIVPSVGFLASLFLALWCMDCVSRDRKALRAIYRKPPRARLHRSVKHRFPKGHDETCYS